jgi:hypothetical protein
MAAPEHVARLDIVEHEVKGLKEVIGQVVIGLNSLKEAVLTIPKHSSWLDQGKVIAITVTVYTAIMGLANGWYDAHAFADRANITRVDDRTRDVDVLRYRLEILEKEFVKKTP